MTNMQTPKDTDTGRASGGRKFFGKYRGTVTINVDPLKTGRLFVEATDALGLFPSNWAMPCFPVAGLQFGAYLIPPVGAGVWVEFEHGDPRKPIWVGCYQGSTPEVATTALLTAPGAPVMILQTILQATVLLTDVPIPPMKGPGVMLKSGASVITIDPTGVQIIAPTVTVVGPTNINAGALVVT